MKRTTIVAVIASILLVTLASEVAHAHPAWGIVVDRQGRVFFADANHGDVVWTIAENGEVSRFVSGKHSHDLFLAADGDLFVAEVTAGGGDKWRSSLWRVTPARSFSVVIPPTDNRKKFWGNAFTLDREHNVYFGYKNNPAAGELADEVLLLKRQPNGIVTVLAGSSEGNVDAKRRMAKFRSLGAMSWGPGDALYVTDVDSIRKVTRDGAVSTHVRGLSGAQPGLASPERRNQLFGLAFDVAGNSYVADFGSRSVKKFDSNGQLIQAIRSDPRWSPVGVVFHGQNLYVMEIGIDRPGPVEGPRVRSISPDGVATTLATVRRTL